MNLNLCVIEAIFGSKIIVIQNIYFDVSAVFLVVEF